jgi:hypothetical protein
MSNEPSSTVYDLKQKVIYLYHFHDFENVVEIHVAEELAKGERVVEMPSLFPAKPAFERFLRASTTDPLPRPVSDAALRD